MRVRGITSVVVVALAAIALAACDAGFSGTPTTEALGTTTVDDSAPEERRTELEDRLKQLEVGRLTAIYDRDVGALPEIHASQDLYDFDVGIIMGQSMPMTERPDADVITYEVVEVLLDRSDCVVASTRIDLTSIFPIDEAEDQIAVLWQTDGSEPLLGAVLAADSGVAAWQRICDEFQRGVTELAFDGCPVTLPPSEDLVVPPTHPAAAPGGRLWYGTQELWTVLRRDGSYSPTKSVWWSIRFPGGAVEEQPDLTVIWENVDEPGVTITSEGRATNANSADSGAFMIANIQPPEEGCWRVTATYKEATLSYVVLVPQA